jgi:hypothetical protein
LAQFADAWGKIVMQLGVPKWAAWNKIPGVEQSEVQGWMEHALDNDPLSKYLREVVGVTANTFGVDPTTGGPTPLPQPDPPPAAPGAATGGPNNAANQKKTNNKTGNPKPTNAKTGK